MTQAVLPGDPPVEITLRRSARARRVSLRVSALDGRVTLSLPAKMSAVEALAFAEQKSEWIRGHLAQQQVPVRAEIGARLLLRGVELPVVAASGRRAAVVDGALHVPDRAAMVAARLKALLKTLARQDLFAACSHYGDAVGREIGKITLRDTRSRWGSCSSTGHLMFSWRLVMAPPEVLDYVAAHEVAHLVELNHSPAYWAVVGDICPGYAAPRNWLRQNGSQLHRYRFDD